MTISIITRLRQLTRGLTALDRRAMITNLAGAKTTRVTSSSTKFRLGLSDFTHQQRLSIINEDMYFNHNLSALAIRMTVMPISSYISFSSQSEDAYL